MKRYTRSVYHISICNRLLNTHPILFLDTPHGWRMNDGPIKFLYKHSHGWLPDEQIAVAPHHWIHEFTCVLCSQCIRADWVTSTALRSSHNWHSHSDPNELTISGPTICAKIIAYAQTPANSLLIPANGFLFPLESELWLVVVCLPYSQALHEETNLIRFVYCCCHRSRKIKETKMASARDGNIPTGR